MKNDDTAILVEKAKLNYIEEKKRKDISIIQPYPMFGSETLTHKKDKK